MLFVCSIQLQLLRRRRRCRRFSIYYNIRSLCSPFGLCVWVSASGVLGGELYDNIWIKYGHAPLDIAKSCCINSVDGAIVIRTKIRLLFCFVYHFNLKLFFVANENDGIYNMNGKWVFNGIGVASMLLPAINYWNQCIRRMREAYSKRRNISLFHFGVSRRRFAHWGKHMKTKFARFYQKRAFIFSMLACDCTAVYVCARTMCTSYNLYLCTFRWHGPLNASTCTRHM